MSPRTILRRAVRPLIAAMLLACAGDSGVEPPPPPAVASVSVAPSPLLLAEGQTASLNASPRDANGHALTGRTVQWVSLDESVATVSATGVVSARAEGVTTIRARSEGKQGDVPVTVLRVTPVPAEVASVSLDVTELSVEEGTVRQLVATPRDASGAAVAGLVMQWTSSDATVAWISAVGEVIAIRP